MILIAYDGSKDAAAAVTRAGELFAGESTTVLTVWEPLRDVLARTGVGLSGLAGMVDYERIDDEYESSGRERADEGAGLARAAGLDARPRTRRRENTIAEAILAEADRVEARAVVMGTRGLTGIKSALLGSVSHAVLQHADRPVLVVPSPDVARERSGQLRRRAAP
jgi:nucleotide-binding universal stress UspA family protein